MPMSGAPITEQIHNEYIEELALLILAGEFDQSSPYRRGWLDGFARCWTRQTGRSLYQLVEAVNLSIEGSGKKLDLNR